jgi:hypothetical protein
MLRQISLISVFSNGKLIPILTERTLSDSNMNKTAFEQRFDHDWIRRMNEWAAPIADEMNNANHEKIKEKKRAYAKTKSFKDAYKKYMKTEKGKAAAKRRTARRCRRHREEFDKLGIKEKDDIRQFYIKCPEGCHVDHIIPLSKGGKHHIKNLQYLAASDNLRKGSKILEQKSDIIYEFTRFRKKFMDCKICKNEMIPLSDETMYCDICKKAFSITYYENNPSGTP